MDIIVFDLCAILVSAILLISSVSRKEYASRTNRIILGFLVTTIIAAAMDCLNGVVASYFPVSDANIKLLYWLNFLYFAAHNLVLFFYVLYIYSSVEIWHRFKDDIRLKIQFWVIFAMMYIPLLFNGTFVSVYYISDDMKYVRGPGIVIFYVCHLLLAVWGIAVLYKYRRLIHLDKIISLILVVPLVVIALIIQIIYPHVLIEMFFVTIALLFFIVMVNREENQVDPISGAIKYDAGMYKVKRDFITNKPEMMIFVKVTNQHNIKLYLGQSHFDKFLRLCTAKLKDIAKDIDMETEVFYMEHGLFAFLIEGTDRVKGTKTAERCHEELCSDLKVEEFTVFPEIKTCLVCAPEDIDDFSVLYTVAATFHKTMDGANNIYLDYKNDKNFLIRNEIKEILERGLRDNRFKMYYQPIYSTIENRFISAEALVRLDDEKYGPISPGVFIPMAENEGYIHELGDFILKDVVRFISENNIEKLGLKYIEMNLSASQCIEVDLVDRIKNLLEDKGVRPEQISLEITENAADINPQIVDVNIEALHNHGVRIALDDYGTGYSNIKRVTSLPIDQVKLDKSFVDMVDDSDMWIVIQDTIKMLKEMGKEVLVEGVEKEEVAHKFMKIDTNLFLGCELIQGFYFCKPLPEDEFVEFIKAHN